MLQRFSNASALPGDANRISMAHLSVKQYDAIEDAVVKGRRIGIWRRGTEYLIIPLALRVVNRRECIDTRHPATGANLRLWLDEIDSIETVR